MKRGRLIVISAPSGAGKSTVIHKLVERNSNFEPSISYTTRQPRNAEKHGVDYRFIQKAEFVKKIESNYFLEWARVHEKYYGTGKSDIEKIIDRGHNALLDIDVQGALIIKSSSIVPVTIFILPPSKEVLLKRLKTRGDLSEKELEIRVKNAREELSRAESYQYIIINKDIEETVQIIEKIILSETYKIEYFTIHRSIS